MTDHVKVGTRNDASNKKKGMEKDQEKRRKGRSRLRGDRKRKLRKGEKEQ